MSIVDSVTGVSIIIEIIVCIDIYTRTHVTCYIEYCKYFVSDADFINGREIDTSTNFYLRNDRSATIEYY